MISVVLSIGSNCGDKKKAVEDALRWLENKLSDFKSSNVYPTPAAGNSLGSYMNAVVKGIYSGDMAKLETACKEYEKIRGRNDECKKNGLVPVDIDIVIAGDKILKQWDYNQDFFQKGYKKCL